MLDLLKVIDESPMLPVWRPFVAVNGKTVEFLIQQLDTAQADVLSRKSSVKIKSGKDGKIRTDHDQTKWRQLMIDTCVKDWRNITVSDVFVLCLADPEKSGVSPEDLSMQAVFSLDLVKRMAARNIQLALFIQGAAMELTSELADIDETEKKT